MTYSAMARLLGGHSHGLIDIITLVGGGDRVSRRCGRGHCEKLFKL